MAAVRTFIVAGSLALLGASACAGLLGISELDVRGAVDAGPSDAHDDADAAPRTFCSSLEIKPDFCDDFEGETDAFERWNGGAAASAGLSNRLIDEPTNTLTIATDERSNSHVIAADVVSKDTGVSIALLAHEVRSDGGIPRALRVSIQARVAAVSFDDPQGGIGNRVVHAAAVGDSVSTQGATIAVVGRKEPDKFDVLVIQRPVQGGDDVVLGTLLDNLDGVSLQNNWFTIQLVFGTEENLRAIGEPCALTDDDRNPVDASAFPGASPNGMRVVAKIAIAKRCLALRDELDVPGWLANPSLLVGAAFGGPGRANVRADNLTASFVW